MKIYALFLSNQSANSIRDFLNMCIFLAKDIHDMLINARNLFYSLILSLFILFSSYSFVWSNPENIGNNYIEAWKSFYPSQAVAQGFHSSIYDFEDFSAENIKNWIKINKDLLTTVSDKKHPFVIHQSIDARLLRTQALSELEKWTHKRPHQHSLSLYTQVLGNSIKSVREAKFLTQSEKNQIICQRLELVQALCFAAKESLKDGGKDELERGMKKLGELVEYFEDNLPNKTVSWTFPETCKDFTGQCRTTALSLQALQTHIRNKILPKAKDSSPILGKKEYARRLEHYTDSPLTPKQLSEIALEEIELVRKLMGEVSTKYLTKEYPNDSVPEQYNDLVRAALTDMEKDAPKNGEEYLEFWLELEKAANTFIEEKEIATLPEFPTLRIMPAPESAGPAARIGWVESAPPFAPNPLTTLYLPSIPESMPEQERIDFWSSFNKPFNRMIVIHELLPGHYMQIKISRESAHPVRLLFPYRLYFEGWATFTERVCLDNGWEEENPLTMLAHLRKRLENANRAYTSVMVHAYHWDKEQVMQFSTETSLLAPQFAKSLWGRLMRSPMQLTSYFLGGKQFTELLAAEKKRQGDRFVLKDFMDTIMKAGPIPVDEFPKIFK